MLSTAWLGGFHQFRLLASFEHIALVDFSLLSFFGLPSEPGNQQKPRTAWLAGAMEQEPV